LPSGSGADHHGGLLALRVRLAILAHWKTFTFLFAALGRMENAFHRMRGRWTTFHCDDFAALD
jgi:hypothetical protein